LASYYNNSDPISYQKYILDGYANTISRLRELKKNIIFIIDTPTLNFDPQVCAQRPFRLTSNINQQCLSTQPLDRVAYDSLMLELMEKFPSVIFL
jgi:hypothetical protein